MEWLGPLGQSEAQAARLEEQMEARLEQLEERIAELERRVKFTEWAPH